MTFVGQGADKTGWNIGAEVPDPANFGTEYNGDYSFDEAYALAGQTSDLKILQVVNPWRTVSMSIPKAILKKKEY